MANLTYNQRKEFGIQIFDIMMNHFGDFFEAEMKTKEAMVANGTYTNVIYKDIIADMEQKYNKVWKDVTLTAHWLGEIVLLQIVGERGYVIEEQGIKPYSNAKKRKAQFSRILRNYNKNYDKNFNLEINLSCITF